MKNEFKKLRLFYSHKFFTSEEGLSIVEVIAAVVFSVIGFGALVALGTYTVKTSDMARRRTQAVEIAKEGIEAVRSIRDNTILSDASDEDYVVCGDSCSCEAWAWSLLSICPWSDDTGSSNLAYYLGTGTEDRWNLQYSSEGDFHNNFLVEIEDMNFYRKLTFNEGPAGDGTDKDIEVTVRWSMRDQEFSVSERTILTNWK